LPSHQTMRSGRVSDATSATHFCSDGRRVPVVAYAPCRGTAVMSRASEVLLFQAGHAILSSAAGAAVLHRIKNGPVAHPPRDAGSLSAGRAYPSGARRIRRTPPAAFAPGAAAG